MKQKTDTVLVKRSFAAKVATKILLPYYVIVDKTVPLKEKAKILATFAYFFLPIDLIPDVLPLIGITDDLTALVLLWRVMRKNISNNERVRQRATARADKMFPSTKK